MLLFQFPNRPKCNDVSDYPAGHSLTLYKSYSKLPADPPLSKRLVKDSPVDLSGSRRVKEVQNNCRVAEFQSRRVAERWYAL